MIYRKDAKDAKKGNFFVSKIDLGNMMFKKFILASLRLVFLTIRAVNFCINNIIRDN